ncbi:hypothetical protein K439DRAFT_1640371 [Ramaria rubella]|nr:hypothetical protein K439DRAFT_1640371 [Ramaria rubella]
MSGRSTVTMTVQREESNLSSMHPLLGRTLHCSGTQSIASHATLHGSLERIIAAVLYVSQL